MPDNGKINKRSECKARPCSPLPPGTCALHLTIKGSVSSSVLRSRKMCIETFALSHGKHISVRPLERGTRPAASVQRGLQRGVQVRDAFSNVCSESTELSRQAFLQQCFHFFVWLEDQELRASLKHRGSEVAFSFFTWRPLVKAYLGAIKSNEAASSHGFDLRGTAHAPAMDGRHRGRPPAKHAARGGRREKPAPQLRIARLGDTRARGGLLGCRGWPLVL